MQGEDLGRQEIEALQEKLEGGAVLRLALPLQKMRCPKRKQSGELQSLCFAGLHADALKIGYEIASSKYFSIDNFV